MPHTGNIFTIWCVMGPPKRAGAGRRRPQGSLIPLPTTADHDHSNRRTRTPTDTLTHILGTSRALPHHTTPHHTTPHHTTLAHPHPHHTPVTTHILPRRIVPWTRKSKSPSISPRPLPRSWGNFSSIPRGTIYVGLSPNPNPNPNPNPDPLTLTP